MTNVYRKPGEVEKEEKQPFPLEKILTVSPRDYCESVGKKLSDYEMRGVHCLFNNRDETRQVYRAFAEKVPLIAEVIVGYTIVAAHHWEYVIGTALIPRYPEQEIELPDTGGPVPI